MNITVILCTYNRSTSLGVTLESFCNLIIPPDLKWELLVVDNNSTDSTGNVCAQFSDRIPLRYVVEQKQGRSCAMNRGISEASADVYVFTDDDVTLSPGWLSEFWNAFVSESTAMFFGGKILPEWECQPPRWLRIHAGGLLRALCGYYDRGEDPHYLRFGEPLFYGANMAFRRDVFIAGGRFREDLGVRGKERLGGEETELMGGLIRNGSRGYYVSTALLYHRYPKNKMSLRYLWRWFKGAGVEAVRRGHYEETAKKWFRAPGYLWRDFITHAWILIVTRYTCPAFVWLPSAINAARGWGGILEFRRRSTSE
jgi:glycosyltransferase involved in cell wall biosynthesis